jgi:type II secretory pathway component PulF
MASTFAPASTKARAHFYSQMSTLLRAGLPILQILEQITRTPPHPSLRAPAGHILGCLRSGRSVTEAFQSLGRWAPSFDNALIDAGERAGRLDQSFATLARHHQERTANFRLILTECMYPAIVLHVAVFVVPIPALFQHGSMIAYCVQVFGTLATIYAVIGLFFWVLQGEHSTYWRAILEKWILNIPLLGSARADLAMARLAGALEALMTAGVLVTEGWPLAAAASGSPLIQRTVANWKEDLASGMTPSDSIQASSVFPELFASTYQTGELSGRLDDQLLWLSRHYEEEGFRKLRTLSMMTPRILYGFIVAWMAYQIFSFATDYQKMIQQILQD